MNRNKKKELRGFTLIEILVVISVIGILAGMVRVLFSGPQKQTRDSRRKSDLNQFQTALENFANENDNLYPQRKTEKRTRYLCEDLGWTKSYCPTDPIDKDIHRYFYLTEDNGCEDKEICATRYILWGGLEGKDVIWVVCSNGRSGEVSTSTSFSDGNCPL